MCTKITNKYKWSFTGIHTHHPALSSFPFFNFQCCTRLMSRIFYLTLYKRMNNWIEIRALEHVLNVSILSLSKKGEEIVMRTMHFLWATGFIGTAFVSSLKCVYVWLHSQFHCIERGKDRVRESAFEMIAFNLKLFL